MRNLCCWCALEAIRVSLVCEQKLRQCQTKRISNEKRAKLNCVRWKSYKFSTLAHERRIANATSFIPSSHWLARLQKGKVQSKEYVRFLNTISLLVDKSWETFIRTIKSLAAANKIWTIIFICFVSPDILHAVHENYTVFCIGRITFSILYYFSGITCLRWKQSSIVHCYKNYKYMSWSIKSKPSSVCSRVGMWRDLMEIRMISLSARLYYIKKRRNLISWTRTHASASTWCLNSSPVANTPPP